MIRFACPGCGAVYTVEDAKGGKTGKCPKCQAQFVIPAPDPSASAPSFPAAPPPVPVSPPAPPPPPAADPNAPVEIAPCPTCQARLSVAVADLGADVECPYCKTVYTARRPGEGRPSRREAPPPARDEDRPSRRRRDEDEDEEDRPRRRRRDEEDAEEDRPRRRPVRDEADDDDRPRRRRREEEDDEDDRPRRRRSSGGRRREQAEAAVSVPSILLMVTGSIGVVLGLVNLALTLGGFNQNPGMQNRPGFETGQYIGAGLGPLISCAILFGGYKMRRLENYSSVMLAAVLAILPCYVCCLWGMVAGIWSLVVLNRDDVKSQFD